MTKNPKKLPSVIASLVAVFFFAATLGMVSNNTALASAASADSSEYAVDLSSDAELAAVPAVLVAAAGVAAGAFVVGFAVGFVKCLLARKAATVEASVDTFALAGVGDVLLD